MPDINANTPDTVTLSEVPVPAERSTGPVSERRLELLKTVQEFAARRPGVQSGSEPAPGSAPEKPPPPVSRSAIAPIRTQRSGIASTVRKARAKAQAALPAAALVAVKQDVPAPAAETSAGLAEDKASPESTALVTAARAAAELVAQEFEHNAKISAEAERARSELAREQFERRTEALQASLKLSEIKLDLADARWEAGYALKSLARERKFRIAAVFAATGLIGVIAAWWLMAPGGGLHGIQPQPVEGMVMQAPLRVQDSPPTIPQLPTAGLPSVRLTPDSRGESGIASGLASALDPGLEPGGTSSDSSAAFTQGIDRLNSALSTVGRGKPEDVLVAIRAFKDPAVCPFVWSDGQISLIYSGTGMTLKSMAETLTRCAKVVEQLGRTPLG